MFHSNFSKILTCIVTLELLLTKVRYLPLFTSFFCIFSIFSPVVKFFHQVLKNNLQFSFHLSVFQSSPSIKFIIRRGWFSSGKVLKLTSFLLFFSNASLSNKLGSLSKLEFRNLYETLNIIEPYLTAKKFSNVVGIILHF